MPTTNAGTHSENGDVAVQLVNSGTDSQPDPSAEIQPEKPPTQAALEKTAEARAVLVKELGTLARNIGSLRTANLKHMKMLNDIPLTSDKRSDLKKLLREEQDRIRDLEEDQKLGNEKLVGLDEKLAQGSVEKELAKRSRIQLKGVQVANDLREQLTLVVAPLLRTWRELHQEDRLSRDMLRSIAPDKMDQHPTFTWVTGIADQMETTISNAIVAAHASRQELFKRDQAKNPPAATNPL